MDEAPLAALRRKPRASVKVAAELVATGDADALFTAGHTGATLLAAHAALGVLPGVERARAGRDAADREPARPCCSTPAPTSSAGPNTSCSSALMGVGVRARRARPPSAARRAALDRRGSGQGHRPHPRSARAAGRARRIDFIGNLDAREIFSGRADVIVCDGFTGNIALKVGEGLAELIERMLRRNWGA